MDLFHFFEDGIGDHVFCGRPTVVHWWPDPISGVTSSIERDFSKNKIGELRESGS